jgi:hypothetical protein
MRIGVDIVMKTGFSVMNVYDIEKGDSDFVGDYAMYRNTSVNREKEKLGWSWCKGKEGKKGLYTVKKWCAGRARGAQGRDRSEGRAKGRKWWLDKEEDKKTTKNGGRKKTFLVPRTSRKSTDQPNQEISEGPPSDPMYLRKGSTWTQEVNLCNV